MMMKRPKATTEKKDDKFQQSNALLSDMIMNYRTIISFGRKNINFLLAKYDKLLEQPHYDNIKSAHKTGGWFFYSVLIRFSYLAIEFFIAIVLIQKKHWNPQKLFKSVFVIFITVLNAG